MIGKWAMMKNLKKWVRSSEDRFPKTLFTLTHCSIAEDDGSGDLLSRSWMHVDKRGEVAMAAQQRRRRKSRCVGSSWLFMVTHSVEAAHIYREDTRTHKKINGKRRPQTYETLDQILTDYSHARRSPVPITSPRHATPLPVRWASTRVSLSLFSPSHTYKCIESNPFLSRIP
jgi:hypothetical protein